MPVVTEPGTESSAQTVSGPSAGALAIQLAQVPTVTLALTVAPYVAMIVTGVLAPTAWLTAGNVALLDASGTTIVDGTESAAGSELASVIVAPPGGAAVGVLPKI